MKMVWKWHSLLLWFKRWNGKEFWIIAIVLLSLLAVTPATAFQLYRDDNLTVHWDNTLKYSFGYRIENQNSALLASVNNDDGNRNFDKGPIFNRFDILSEFDMVWQNFGLRLSGAAWYDFVYNTSNDNDSPATVNHYSQAHDEFTTGTRDRHGRDGEILDAFVFGKGRLGDIPVSVRIGKHTLLWGESLFLATNGISYGQAPIDIVKLIGVPGTLSKELFRPIEQVSFLMQPLSNLSVAGYYKWKWEEGNIPGVGSYLSSVDLIALGERIFVGPGVALFAGDDIEASDSGQWGVSLMYQPSHLDWEFGLYYYNFHDQAPQVYIAPGANVDFSIGKVGEYYLVYPENIEVLGFSAATQLWDLSLAAEVSLRFDMPLVSNPQVMVPGADNDENPLYAIGDTFHTQVSFMYFLKPGSLWQGGIVLGEAGYCGYTDINENVAALNTARNREVFGFRVIFKPEYYQVFPNIDVGVPIGFAYNPKGKSSISQKFNGGSHQAGDFSLGLDAELFKTWRAGIKYTGYFGEPDDQDVTDRDHISFYVQRSF